jgi:hypothetical protein
MITKEKIYRSREARLSNMIARAISKLMPPSEAAFRIYGSREAGLFI